MSSPNESDSRKITKRKIENDDEVQPLNKTRLYAVAATNTEIEKLLDLDILSESSSESFSSNAEDSEKENTNETENSSTRKSCFPVDKPEDNRLDFTNSLLAGKDSAPLEQDKFSDKNAGSRSDIDDSENKTDGKLKNSSPTQLPVAKTKDIPWNYKRVAVNDAEIENLLKQDIFAESSSESLSSDAEDSGKENSSLAGNSSTNKTSLRVDKSEDNTPGSTDRSSIVVTSDGKDNSDQRIMVKIKLSYLGM